MCSCIRINVKVVHLSKSTIYNIFGILGIEAFSQHDRTKYKARRCYTTQSLMTCPTEPHQVLAEHSLKTPGLDDSEALKLFSDHGVIPTSLKYPKCNSDSIFREDQKITNKGDGLPKFGLLFDIDGVLVRGKKILPTAPDAFQRLVDKSGKFRIPTVFVTNAGNKLRHDKAKQLSEWLNVEVHEDQVVMAHSPLKMFDKFFDKQMLVSGQGPVKEIAYNLGFTKITTVDDLRAAFPQLDCIDHKRRSLKPAPDAPFIPQIGGLLLFGEPVRWETSLQYLIDVLMTGGSLMGAPTSFYPHLPILACNMDLQWMAEANMPRFGHGAFLLCLEALFKKVTGKDLIYTALVGKPSEITYYHSETMVQHHARMIGIEHPITTLYAIGDNIHTDIFGMNLYREYLRRRRASSKQIMMQGARGLDLSTHDFKGLTAENCYSVLVKTGVYNGKDENLLEHSPRDFLPVEAKLQEPSITVGCVFEAINMIFTRENFS